MFRDGHVNLRSNIYVLKVSWIEGFPQERTFLCQDETGHSLCLSKALQSVGAFLYVEPVGDCHTL